MKRGIIYSITVFLTALVLLSCGAGNDGLPSLKESFSYKDKDPFGAFVVHQQLTQLFYHNTIRKVNVNFERTWRDISDTGALYVNISRNLHLSPADLSSMLNFVEEGNSLFIASGNFDQRLLDTLGCSISQPLFMPTAAEMKYTAVHLSREVFMDTTVFRYFYIPFSRYFTKTGNSQSKPLGFNRYGPNFIVMFFGRGRIYLHAEPRALSNYFLLQKNNYRYAEHLFSFMPFIPEHVYWDDYYNKRNSKGAGRSNKSGLAVLLQYPAMNWAFWLLLLLCALYVLFEGKRRQRVVNNIPPNTNTTLTFTETIGRLYLQQKDNRNIADKLVTYFLEHIRNQFYLDTNQADDAFITILGRKSNNSKKGTLQLFELIRKVQQSNEITDEQLLLLNRLIENFHKNKL